MCVEVIDVFEPQQQDRRLTPAFPTQPTSGRERRLGRSGAREVGYSITVEQTRAACGEGCVARTDVQVPEPPHIWITLSLTQRPTSEGEKCESS